MQHMRVLEQEISLYFGIVIFMSNFNFMLSWAEHVKSFIQSEGCDFYNLEKLLTKQFIGPDK